MGARVDAAGRAHTSCKGATTGRSQHLCESGTRRTPSQHPPACFYPPASLSDPIRPWTYPVLESRKKSTFLKMVSEFLESRENHTCKISRSEGGRDRIPHLVAGNYAIAYTDVAIKPSVFKKCNITFVNCVLILLCEAITYIVDVIVICIFT